MAADRTGRSGGDDIMTPCLLLAIIPVAVAAWLLLRLRKRNVDRWLVSYFRGNWAGRRESPVDGEPIDILFCIADHFEPGVRHADEDTQRRRVDQWVEQYPRLFNEFRDSDGRPPRHTFFFPEEQYLPYHLNGLAELARQGFGEVEIHLHHDNDTAENLRGTLKSFKGRLKEHGHLGVDRTGATRFGFVHGNWALDNSLPDGRWCGVNEELRLLADCGCYADFTLPSAPSPAQTRKINSIYYAKDDAHPRSHDDGRDLRVGGEPWGDLMIIQGPLSVFPTGGKWGILPRLENANLAHMAEPSPRRIQEWLRTRVCISGRPNWVFVKLHTHGCAERNMQMLLGEPMRRLHQQLASNYNDGKQYRLHYVTAREMYNIAKAAENGVVGDPGRARDREIAPPDCVALKQNSARMEAAS